MKTAITSTAVHHLLRDLIEINNDRASGFAQALKDLDRFNDDLKKLFEQFIAQSKENSRELLAIGTENGMNIENETSVTASVHRVWIDLKSLFNAQNRHNILTEAERGEDMIKTAYRDALAADYLESDILAVVSKQAEGIKAAHDQIKALRDASK